jgi:effector-binding domain-containing protein
MVCEIIDRPIPDSGDIQTLTLPGGEFASYIHKGSYEGLHQAYITVMKWIDDQGLVICGPDREVYHENMATTENPQEFVTEILIPIKEK